MKAVCTKMRPVRRQDTEVEPNVASNLSRFRGWAKRWVGVFSVPSRMEITIQTDRLMIIRRRQSGRVWCEQCRREVEVVGLQDAGNFAGSLRPALPGNTGSEAWHVCIGKNGERVICLESLLKTGEQLIAEKRNAGPNQGQSRSEL